MSLVDSSDEKKKVVVMAPELDYKKVAYSHPTYKLSKLLPLSGASSVTITPGSNPESQIEIPTKAHNWAKTNLVFNMNPDATAAAYNYLFEDTLTPIRQFQVLTRGGAILADVNNAQNYIRIVRKKETPFADYECFDSSDRLYKCNKLQAVGTIAGLRPDNTAGTVAYVEPNYLVVGGSATATPLIQVCFNMGAIKNCLLSYNKDIYFPEVLILRIVWGSNTKVGFSATAANTAPTAGIPFIGNVNISNLALYLAIETDKNITSALIGKVMSGTFSVTMPFIYSYLATLTGTSSNVSLRFSTSHGRSIIKIIHTIWSSTEQALTAYDSSNIAGAKLTSYYTLLDGERLQEFTPDCVGTNNFDDYMLNKKFLHGSSITTRENYQYNWFHQDSFVASDIESKELPAPESNLVMGKSLENGDIKWDFYGTMASNVTAYNHYTFVIAQRVLSIAPNAISIR
jgi:hypothetical protein